jgi:hypothetical protein
VLAWAGLESGIHELVALPVELLVKFPNASHLDQHDTSRGPSP